MCSVINSMQGGRFQRSPYPYDIQGDQYHGFSLTRAFMPLSAPISEIVENFNFGVSGKATAFLRALLVFIRDFSHPNPLDQQRIFLEATPIWSCSSDSPLDSSLVITSLP
jgi:hypothetical protein